MFRSPNTPSPGKDSSKSIQSNTDDSGGVDKIEQQIDYSKLSDAEIIEKYSQVLDSLLLPPYVKDKMIKSESREKKIQMIQMHTEAVDTKVSNEMDEQMKISLLALKMNKLPDISSVIRIRTFLSTSSAEGVNSFLHLNGIEVLQKCIDSRLDKILLNELDAAILFELLSCYKCILNKPNGIQKVATSISVVNQIVRSLRFDWKPIALLVMEMLSVCCYYSAELAHAVVKSFRTLGKARNEFPFVILLNALIDQDVEIKASVGRLINDVIMGLPNIEDRSVLRTELLSVLFNDRYKDVISALPALSALEGAADMASPAPSEKQTLKPTYPPNAIVPKGALTDFPYEAEGSVSVRRGREVFVCCPKAGTMCGNLVALKGFKTLNEGLLDAFGMKKTKERWYQTDGEMLKWYQDDVLKGALFIANIVDIRDYTTDPTLMKESGFCIEIQAVDRTLKLGCATAEDKDFWLTAVTVARDTVMLKKSSYKLQIKELTSADIVHYSQTLIKHSTVYFSLLSEDREQLVTAVGLDLTNAKMVSEYLYHETMALGLSEEYLTLLRELLLVPPGSDAVWSTLVDNIKRLRKLTPADMKRAAETGDSSVAWTDQSITAVLNARSAGVNSEFNQMSRLALTAMSKDYEIQELKAKIDRLEGHIKGTHQLTGQDLDGMNISATQRSAIELAARSYTTMYSHASTVATIDDLIGSMAGTGIAASAPAPVTVSVPASVPAPALAEAPPSSSSALNSAQPEEVQVTYASPKEDPAFKLYFQMLDSNSSIESIKQKMMMDGKSAADVAAFVKVAEPMKLRAPSMAISRSVSIATPQPSVAAPTAAAELLASTTANTAESVDPVTSAIDTPSTPATVVPSADTPTETIVDERTAKFVKMIKVLPPHVVRQKMLGEGLPEAVVEAFLAQQGVKVAEEVKAPPTVKVDPADEPPPAGLDKKKPVAFKSKKKFKALFWVRIRNSDIPGTVWMDVNQNFPVTKRCFEAIEEHFNTDKLDAAAAKKATAATASAGASGLVLFDSKRTQNVLIFLSRVQLSTAQLTAVIIRLDPKELDLSLCEKLLQICPSSEEIASSRAFESPSELDPVGQLFHALGGIPRVERRLKIHETCFKWDSEATGIIAQLNVYLSACEEIKASEKIFNKLFGMVLGIGNILNDGTARGVAYGVKLDVITRLLGVKSSKSSDASAAGTEEFAGSSLLHLVAWEAHTSGFTDIFTILDKWQAVVAAADLNYRQLETDVRLLGDQIKNIRNESDAAMVRIREEGGDAVAEPLKARIQGFVHLAEPKMLTIVNLKNEVAEKLKDTLTRFNEPFNALDDSVKGFFGNIHIFLRAFRQAVSENETIRSPPQEKSAGIKGGVKLPFNLGGILPKPLKPTKTEPAASEPAAAPSSMFADYHSVQNSSADDVVEQFKRRQRQAF